MRKTLATFAALMLLAFAGLAGTPTLHAQARPTLTQNIDEPGRTPFQTTVSLSYATNTLYVSVPIPPGKRLVVDYVSTSGAASSQQGPIQPIIILSSSVAGSPSANFYFTQVPSTLVTSQFALNGPVAIYADTLAVSFGFSGYTPSYAGFNVVISGHLISNPIAS